MVSPLLSLLLLFGSPLPAGAPLPECSLTVRVHSDAGQTLDSAQIQLSKPGVDGLLPTTRKDGSFFFQVEPGTYTLKVRRPGFEPAEHTVTLTQGQSRDLDVTLDFEGVYERIAVAERRQDSTVFKLATSLHETPRAVTVVDEHQIRERNFRSVNDTFAYTPGYAVNSYRTGGYHFYARGYRMGPEDTRIDGFSGVNAGGRYSSSLFGIEQVVLLRGPAGLLYGATGAPGGMVNMVTKKPSEVAATRLDVRTATYAGNGVDLGDRNTGGLELDSTGRLDASGRVLYRVLGLAENAAYFTDGVEDENRALNLTLTVNLDQEQRFRLSPTVQWTRFDRPNGGGIVFSPSTSLTTNDGLEGPIHLDDLSPLSVNTSVGGGLDETVQLGFQFQADFTPELRLNASYRAINYDTHIDQYAPTVSTAAQRALLQEGRVMRTHSISDTERRYDSADLNTTYEFGGERGWRSLFQLGLNSRVSSTRGTSPSGSVPGAQSPIDIYTGEVFGPLDDTYPALTFNPWSDTTTWNGYLQNQTSFADGKVVTTLGLGYGQVRPESRAAQNSDLMPNAAVVYNLSRQLALFASYANSFSPTDPEAQDAAGNSNVFDPEDGTNLEVGFKLDQANGSSLQFSVFKNELNNDLVQSATNDLNPNGVRYYEQVGTREAQGAELSANGRIKGLQLAASVSYLDATYTGEGPAGSPNLPLPGTRAEKAPEWSTSLWLAYDLDRTVRGLSANLGWIWSDERLGSNRGRTETEPDPLMLPSYHRLDLGLSYALPVGVDLQLNLQNLTDELIFVNGSTGSSLEVAAPRTLNLRVGYRF